MIPPRLLRHVDRESIAVMPVGDQFRVTITVDDRLLFMGKLWAEFSDAASEGYEEYLRILDDRETERQDELERDELRLMTPGERLDYYRAEGA